MQSHLILLRLPGDGLVYQSLYSTIIVTPLHYVPLRSYYCGSKVPLRLVHHQAALVNSVSSVAAR